MSASQLPHAAQSGSSVVVAKARRTAGNLTLNSTTWADVDTGIDLTIAAVAGDELEIGLSMGVRPSGAGISLALDVATIVSAAPVNYFATAGGATEVGAGAWYREAPTVNDASVPGGPRSYTVQAGDISGGNVVLRLRYKVNSGSWTGYATANLPLDFWVKNLG